MAGTPVDVSQYMTWEKWTSPTGNTYYKVPGTGWLYNPFLSQSKGRSMFFQDPRPQLEEKQKIIDQQKRAASPLGQIAPVLGGTAGILGSKWALDQLGPTSALEEAQAAYYNAEAAKVASQIPKVVTQPGIVGTESVASEALATAPTTEAGSIFQVGTAADGGALMSDGTVAAQGAPLGEGFLSGIMPGGGTLGAAVGIGSLGAYLSNMYEGGVKDIAKGEGKGEDYTNLALDINPVTAPINMALRAMGLPSVGRRLATGKSEEQQTRDDFRSQAQKLGFADDKYNVNFSDGSSFNIGKDGSERLVSKDGSERHYYDIDWKDPLSQYASSKLIPLINNQYGDKKPKQLEQYIGMITNSVVNGATDQATIDKRVLELQSKLSGSQTSPTAPPIQTQRSQTISPGISKTGQRIDYGKELAKRMNSRGR